ncbi:MAG: isomerase [Planctomycetes bacterium]|nr:isomerase [Planctomycetota bacterium]
MKLGMNMLLWTGHVTEEHVPIFGELREAGFDGVEIAVGEGDADHYKKLGAACDQVGLERSIVTILDVDTNPISPDKKIREAAVERLRWVIEMTNAFGGTRLTGPFHSAYKTFEGRGATDDERRWCADVMREVADEAYDAGMVLALEPLNRFECYLMNTSADARAVIDLCDHPNVGMLYDTHHMHIEEKDAAAAVKLGGSAIRHVHASECDRGRPGSGQVAWDATFRALHEIGYDDWLVIEAFSTMDKDFAAAIHIWRDFDPPEEIWRDGGAFVRQAWESTAS